MAARQHFDFVCMEAKSGQTCEKVAQAFISLLKVNIKTRI
jgi:hypothetical protein